MKKYKKAAAAVAFLVLAICLSCITLSYLGGYDTLENKFKIGHNKSSIDETFTPKIQKNGINICEKKVAVKNEENVPCYVRLYVDFTDSVSAEKSCFSNDEYNENDTDGSESNFFSAVRDVNIGAGTADNVTDDSFVRRLNEGFFTNSATDPTKWRFVPDNDTTVLKGYYYYTEPVEPNESTETLFKQVKVQNASNEDVKAFNVLVYSETVQAQGYADYEAAWADFLSEPVETTTAPEP